MSSVVTPMQKLEALNKELDALNPSPGEIPATIVSKAKDYVQKEVQYAELVATFELAQAEAKRIQTSYSGVAASAFRIPKAPSTPSSPVSYSDEILRARTVNVCRDASNAAMEQVHASNMLEARRHLLDFEIHLQKVLVKTIQGQNERRKQIAEQYAAALSATLRQRAGCDK
jgi:hypothetical protein